jgi:NAD(P)-dependent dehydrogenase (short-subunit alcohol dehydrogenase family)
MSAEPNPRTVVITGANSGIGKAAAVPFAADGFHFVVACRDLARSEAQPGQGRDGAAEHAPRAAIRE